MKLTINSNNNNNNNNRGDLTFENVMDTEHNRDIFRAFLHKTLNSDPLLFIETVEQYERMKSHANRYECAKQMIETFIRESSPNEINISQATRRDTIRSFEKNCSIDHCPKQLFDSCSAGVLLELKEDVWPRFLTAHQSELIISVPATPIVNMMNSFNTPLNDNQSLSLSTDEELDELDNSTTAATPCEEYYSNNNNSLSAVQQLNPDSPHFTDQEIQLLRDWTTTDKRVAGASWQKMVIRKEYQSYVTDKPVTILKGGRQGRLVRTNGIIDGPIDSVLEAALSIQYRQEIDDRIMITEQLAYIPGTKQNKYAVTIIRATISPRFVTPREFVMSATVIKETVPSTGLKRYISFRKAINWRTSDDLSSDSNSSGGGGSGNSSSSNNSGYSSSKKEKKMVRAEHVGVHVFEQVNEQDTKTRYIDFHYADMKGSIPVWLVNMSLKHQGKSFHEGTKYSVRRLMEDTDGKGGKLNNMQQVQTMQDHYQSYVLDYAI